MIHTADTALFSEAFPVNPRPFRAALADHLASGGTMTSPHARRILWTLTGIVRGQLFCIDLAENASLHNDHLARLPGRTHAAGVLSAMEIEADGLDTTDTIRQWWSSIASLILFSYGSQGILDACLEWEILHKEYTAGTHAKAAA